MRRRSRLHRVFPGLFAWILLGAAPGASPARAEAPSLASFAQIEAFLRERPGTTLDELVGHLSAELRSRFQLPYDSRSPIGSSLETPRIVLSSADGGLLLGFAGDARMKNGQQLEIIERDPRTSRLRFRRIDFTRNGPRIQRDPVGCAKCHGSKRNAGLMRPIWDGYPDWPGVLGGSHNNLMMGRGGNGASTVPDLEYEAKALEKLQAAAPARPRFAALIGLEKTDLRTLAQRSGRFTDALVALHFANLLGAFAERLAEIDGASHAAYLQIRARILALLERPTLAARFIVTEPSADLLDRLRTAHERKLARLQAQIRKYGTAADLDLLEHDWRVVVGDEFRFGARKVGVQALPLQNPNVRYIALLEELFGALGLDPDAAAITRELGTSAHAVSVSLYDRMHALFWETMQLVKIEARPRTFAELRCRDLLFRQP